MKNEELINIKELIVCHNLDDAFFDGVASYELIEIVVKDSDRFVYLEALPTVEQIIRLHYDLNINMEGIEVIKNMLERMESLQSEVRKLQNRLNIYE